jgi:hypothetical protein
MYIIAHIICNHSVYIQQHYVKLLHNQVAMVQLFQRHDNMAYFYDLIMKHVTFFLYYSTLACNCTSLSVFMNTKNVQNIA